ncbi:butyrophilin subfamily 3 member A1-like [Hoplias malabaricus]|uniref:butyrophilin subfamily 3 member A1-like n=1 Tax=Hoplias malabaricus TaxID=27720 RepID=UPI00346284C3
MFLNKWEKLSSSMSWNVPDNPEVIHSATHSVPWTKPTLSNKPGLRQIQTLQECTLFLTDMAKEAKDISKGRKKHMLEKHNDPQDKSTKPVSVDQSKSLILSWAKELTSLNLPRGKIKGSVPDEPTHSVKSTDVSDYSKNKDMIMKWAKELQMVSENLGLTDDDLQKILSNRSMEKLKVVGLLPFLEFVVWSLLSQQSEEDISKLWLSAKQRMWKTGSQKYIPNSAWQWIQSASADVRLDSRTAHPWLCVSEDKREVYERQRPQDQQENPQKFDELSCVLGLKSFSSGRHYWQVVVPVNRSWRLGVASASAPRKGNFQMAPENGYWIIWNGSKNLWACTNPPTNLPKSLELQVVGVYVDYEEGQTSFYDAERRLHIYTFTHIFKEALFPMFMCLDSTVLKIHT